MNYIEDFHIRRSTGNQKVSEQEFLPYNRFFNLDTHAYENGAIPTKYKELMGLVGSLILRCNDCVMYHLENCVKLKCSKLEINESMNIALVIGGSIVVPHLRFALTVLDELMLDVSNSDKEIL